MIVSQNALWKKRYKNAYKMKYVDWSVSTAGWELTANKGYSFSILDLMLEIVKRKTKISHQKLKIEYCSGPKWL